MYLFSHFNLFASEVGFTLWQLTIAIGQMAVVVWFVLDLLAQSDIFFLMV